MKKILLFLLIIFVSYILIIFSLPTLASKIGEIFGLTDFNNKVVEIKQRIDDLVTRAPSKDDIVDKYNEVYSGATQLKDSITEGIDQTKTKIDDVRDAVKKTTDAIDQTKESINNTIDTIGELQDSINNVIPSSGTGDISNSGVTN